MFKKKIIFDEHYKSKHLNINNKILIGIIIVLFFAVKEGKSQDIHFTQFYASPLTLNPALTGVFDGDWRVSANYRNQWRAIGGYPFTTFSFGWDRPIRIYSEQVNVGIVVLHDQSGVVNLTTNRFYGNISYLKKIGRNTLALGIQPGYVTEGYDISKYSFNEQFDLGNTESMFNTSLNNYETGYKNSIAFFDLNAGLLWNCRLSKSFTPQIGYTLFHINRPNRSFKNLKSDTTEFGMRNVIEARAIISLGQQTRVIPHILTMFEKGASEALCGGNFEQDLSNPVFKTVYAGAMFRYGWNGTFDASSAIVGVKWKNFDLGFSYDINVSSLKKATNMRGAWEVSLIYISRSTKPSKIKIPCDRL